MSTESTKPNSAPAFPITDEVRHALAVTKRGVDELLIEDEFAQKLARSQATASRCASSSGSIRPRLTSTSAIRSC